MQIVIDISKKDYEDILNGETKASALNWSTFNAIRDGIPMPKGHGDLIDISKLPVTITYFGISDKPVEVVNYNCILNAKKIIKADKTQNNKNKK